MQCQANDAKRQAHDVSHTAGPPSEQACMAQQLTGRAVLCSDVLDRDVTISICASHGEHVPRLDGPCQKPTHPVGIQVQVGNTGLPKHLEGFLFVVCCTSSSRGVLHGAPS